MEYKSKQTIIRCIHECIRDTKDSGRSCNMDCDLAFAIPRNPKAGPGNVLEHACPAITWENPSTVWQLYNKKGWNEQHLINHVSDLLLDPVEKLIEQVKEAEDGDNKI